MESFFGRLADRLADLDFLVGTVPQKAKNQFRRGTADSSSYGCTQEIFTLG